MMNDFISANQVINSDKYIEILKQTVAKCEQHGSYLQSQLLLRITSREVTTKCPICEEISKQAATNKEVQEYLIKNQQEVKANQIKKLFTRSGIPPRFAGRTFENFIQTTDNAHNLARVKEFCSNIKANLTNGHGLIFFGSKGTGKTHLSCAIAESAINQQMSALFITAGEMVDDVKEAFSGGKSEKSKVANYTVPDLLIIDEVLAGVSEYEVKTIAKILNARYNQKRSTIIITNLNVSTDESGVATLGAVLGERIIDRLRETNAAIRFTGSSFRDINKINTNSK